MRASSARIALLAVSALGVLPFLLPAHRPPILSFYDEWLAMALAASALTVFALGERGRDASVPQVSLWLVALAGWVLVQAAIREPAFPQLPLGGAVYLLSAAAIGWVGHELARRLGAQMLIDTLAAAILAGALANAAIGIAQVRGIPAAFDGFVGSSRSGSIVGHVGQPNHLASYLAFGMASLAYLVGRARLPVTLAWPCGALLVLASGYTGSRSSIAFALWMAALALAAFRRAGPEWRPMARSTLLLSAGTLVAVLALPKVHGALAFRFALERILDPGVLHAEVRPDLWLLAVRLFLDSPWLGIGWGEFAGAAFRAGLPQALAETDVVWTSPHNAPLQLLAEAGVAGAAIALLAALHWWRNIASRLRQSPTLADGWVAAVVGLICLQALVEYPLWYAHVLLLLALCAGIGSRPALVAHRLTLRAAIPFAGVALAGLLAWTLADYLRFDRATPIVSGRTMAPPAEVDKALRDLYGAQRGPLGAKIAPRLFESLRLDRNGLEDRLDLGARVLRVWPAPPVIARHAAYLALANRQDEALALVRRTAASAPEARARLLDELRSLSPSAPGAIEPLLQALTAKQATAARG